MSQSLSKFGLHRRLSNCANTRHAYFFSAPIKGAGGTNGAKVLELEPGADPAQLKKVGLWAGEVTP